MKNRINTVLSFALICLGASLVCSSCNGQNNQLSEKNKTQFVSYSDLEFKTEQQEELAYYNNQLFSGWSVIYAKDSVKYIEQEYLEGKKDGVWKIYYPNGQLQKKGQMLNGLDHGEYNEYYQNGIKQYEYHYDNGKKVGKWLSWYEDGTPYTERNFVNDQIDGKVFVWDETGKLAKEYDYKNNVLVNSIMHFQENKE